MTPDIQDTLFQLFEQVRLDPDTSPAALLDGWQEGSAEWRLLDSFRGMMEQVHERIHQLKQAEEQLREQEEQYRNIFEASFDGINISTLGGPIVEANPALCRMFGYTREEVLSISPALLIHPDSLHVMSEVLQEVGAGYESLKRATCLRKDGTSFLIESHVTPFTYKGQRHILSVTRDITERVEAEKQMREKEEQYRSIFEATSDGLIIRNMDGAVVQVNPAACKMHGYSYEEYLALSRDSLIHPDYHPRLREIIQTVKAGRVFQGQAVDLRKDGSTFPVEFRSDPFTFLGQPHMLTVLRDITERVEAERQLREREEQYRSIFEATYDGIDILDLDGFFVEVNPAFCHMYGYSREELLGLHTRVLFPPELHQYVDEAVISLKSSGVYQTTGPSLRKDGTAFYVEGRGMVFTYKGKPHTLSVIRDITERVQAQQLLEQRVEERTRELSTLLEVSHNVASTIDLKLLLELILDQLRVVVDYAGSAITILEDEDLVLVGTRGPESEEHLVQHRFPLQYMRPIWEALCRGELVVIDDMLNDTPMARAYRETVSDLLETTLGYVRSWVAVPLKLKDQVIGILSMSHSIPDFYTPHHAELALAIANQAAMAIENARLYAQAQELAALEERQKLARELHDSVSQALYGISLGAHAARTALSRAPGEVAEPLDYVLSLAEAGLAEMRALIFELRPESLETEGLVAALTKQAAALQARHELVVSTELCDEPALPLRVKQELYRIAQEAMHNTVKHAHASSVALRLAQTTEGVTMEVRDDGVGFDTTASFPGHLGLHSMRERVMNLGGTFEMESTPGEGTRLCMRVPGHV